jgi:transposase
VAEESRLSCGISVGAVRHRLEAQIAYLVEEIKETEQMIQKHINNHPDLKEQSDLLDSIPGIGAATAALLLAEITNITQKKVRGKSPLMAGLVPRERRSGTSVRGRVRLSKVGNARLRKALYFPAITALRCSDFFKSWADGLPTRGKCKMSVIGAAMRKLIHLAYGVLKTV